jgi:aspartate beta-hydroxylase
LLLDVWRRDMPVDMELLSRAVVGMVRLGMKWNGVRYEG